MALKKYLFTSESVTEGHPDKVCDQISDAVYDEMLKQDVDSHAGIECFATTGLVIVGGEARTKAYVNIQDTVRRVLREIGYDKQEMIAAHIIYRILWEIFEKRFERIKDKNNLATPVIIDKCLINLVINIGNHDLWENYAKSALPLSLLHSQLKLLLMKNIIDMCEKNGLKSNLSAIESIIEEKIIGVGENNIVEINGVPIGLKHPHKARTLTKSHRIQEVASFFSEQKFKDYPDLSLVYVANFHEAAAVSVSIFGRTILGVMTGAYLKDTIFETHKDKVVDYGSANVNVCFNSKKQIIYSEVDFDQRIHPLDKKIVLADKLTSKDIMKLCLRLCNIVNLPWRSN